jgi:hypothetical protein
MCVWVGGCGCVSRYENECTRVEDFLFVAGIRVAQNLDLLKVWGLGLRFRSHRTSASSRLRSASAER